MIVTWEENGKEVHLIDPDLVEHLEQLARVLKPEQDALIREAIAKRAQADANDRWRELQKGGEPGDDADVQ